MMWNKFYATIFFCNRTSLYGYGNLHHLAGFGKEPLIV